MKLKLRLMVIVVGAFMLTHTHAQNLAKAEYFFNIDPGQGNGINIPVTPGASLNFTANISTVGLPAGFHMLGLRVKQNGGVWSLFEGRGFYISTASPNTTNISKAEYFIDTDPGQGNGTAITIPGSANVNFTFPVPTTSLAAGFHFLAIRTRDTQAHWSILEARGFFITTSTTNVPNITAAEYFYDTDPGNGAGLPLSISSGASVNFTVPLPVGGLTPGFHFLGVRVKTLGGKWGIFESRGFYVSGSVTNAPGIAGAEYFFDTDPGSGNGKPLTIPTGNISNFSLNLPIESLTPGFHFLTIRVKDSFGRWGQFETRGFYVYQGALAAGDIVAAEYFIDTDPGQGLAIAADVTTPALNINQVFPLEISGVSPGSHKLGFRVRDEEGVWSEPRMSDITVLNCIAPSAPVAISATRCNAGLVKLSATGAGVGQQYKWYAEELTGSSVFTGVDFTTPVIQATTDFFVSVFDPVTTCESGRVKATAGVVPASKPLLSSSGTVSLCEGSSFSLSAPAGFTTYAWSDGATTQTRDVTVSGKYSVTASNENCSLPVSDEVTINFVSRPAAPTITVTGLTTLCNDSFTVLSAPAGFTHYEWSNGEPNQIIIVKDAGTYSVKVGNIADCFSALSSAIVVTQTGQPCTSASNPNPNNIPPEIEHAEIATAIRGKATLDLIPLISDHNGTTDIIFSTLKITEEPASGANATIDNAGSLTVDYTQVDFSGSDFLTIQVCDASASCTQGTIDITVAGDITSFNALSPNGDGLNESLYLEFIEIIPDTKENKVTIFNRWGSSVFEMVNYNNDDRVFKGMDQDGKELPNGTYFYRIEFGSGKKTKDGFITLRR